MNTFLPIVVIGVCLLVVATATPLSSGGPNGNPTIFCRNYTVGCNVPPKVSMFDPLYDNALIHVAKTVGEMSKYLGCWCQNNGTANAVNPHCPAWLTCPKPLTDELVVLAYQFENLLSDNACHCQCVADECPGYTVQ